MTARSFLLLAALLAGLAPAASATTPAVEPASEHAAAPSPVPATGSATSPAQPSAAGASADVPPEAGPAPRARPAPGPRSCTPDGRHCIAAATYLQDVCHTIDAVARESGLDRDFFARLLWQESLFDAAAVSPAGAQGIAQFMPGTAALRGLKDAFNPAEALQASARYLAELSAAYGNIGLAAVAYNGGEARAARYLAKGDRLPDETLGYVLAITGHPAEDWRARPPATLDLSLRGSRPGAAAEDFREACVTMASQRRGQSLRPAPPPLPPWGVVLASNRDRDGAERQVARLRNRHGGLLAAETVRYGSGRNAGFRNLQVAQIGRPSREAADALCARLHAAGADCLVMKN